VSREAAEGQAARTPHLVRLDPAVHDALARWADDELRSFNAQVELLLRDALRRAGRLPKGLKPPRKPGRPPAGEAAGEPPGESAGEG
jgi:hypothetical protein